MGDASGSNAMSLLRLGLLWVARAAWPECQEEHIVIRNAGRALFTPPGAGGYGLFGAGGFSWMEYMRNLQGFGATVGCFQERRRAEIM